MRDSVVTFISYWKERTGFPVKHFLTWLGLSAGKYADWKHRQGKPNRHNGKQPRRFWLQAWEQEAIIGYAGKHSLQGYRRLCYMMLDADVVAVSPSSVYRVLRQAGMLQTQQAQSTQKGEGFEHPTEAHAHWHTDVSYLNLGGTFYYFISVLDGYSRFIVHWEIRKSMTEEDIQIVLQRAHEDYPEAKPRLISDNGPQYLAKDFKEFVRLSGMTHVRTSAYYPQSNGKQERWHKTLKVECIRPQSPVSLDDARRLVATYVEEYNKVRLHSAIGYIAPIDKLEGREDKIFAVRKIKLNQARKARSEAGRCQKTEDTASEELAIAS